MSKKSKHDYPFTNWTTYFNALKESFQSEDFGAIYPKYYAAMDKRETTNCIIMKNLLELHPTKEWAQEGLDGWIQTCILGHRYCIDAIESFEPAIHALLRKGATINYQIILTPFTRNDLEEEGCALAVRARLLIFFEVYASMKIPSVIMNASPLYWEDLLKEGGDFMTQFYRGIRYELKQ